jgi:hypothetical protein
MTSEVLATVIAAVVKVAGPMRRILLKELYDLQQKFKAKPRRRRRTTFVPVDVFALPDHLFVEHFRFSKDDVRLLAEAYKLPDRLFYEKTRQSMCAPLAMAVVLARLATTAQWNKLELLFGRGRSTLKSFFRITITWMFTQCRDRIQRPSRSFLTDQRLAMYSDAIRLKGGLYNNVFGFIDGTVFKISRPSGHTEWQRSVYNGHKRCHGLKFQGVSTPDGLIQFMHGPYQGRQHDDNILEQSGLLTILEQKYRLPQERVVDWSRETHFMLFGDPGTLA